MLDLLKCCYFIIRFIEFCEALMHTLPLVQHICSVALNNAKVQTSIKVSMKLEIFLLVCLKVESLSQVEVKRS